jgi:non-homologous end joining protein Ku
VAAPRARERAPGKVVDLMEVLKKSLRQPPPSKARAGLSRTRAHPRRRAAS